ncbi:MAG: sulfatase-like hydrolase/transferase [Pseudomonadota bacterium]
MTRPKVTRPPLTRPNILLVSADQQRGDCIGVEGRRIKTPHLDALAAAGTRFTAAITPCVVCQPARASILTGQLPRTHGVHDNGIDLDPATGARGFAGMLAAAGYDTGFFGKAHFSTFHTHAPTGTPECLTSSADWPADWYGPYMGFAHVELMLVGHNWFPPEKPPAGQHYERWFHADGQGDAKNALYLENAGDTRGAAQTWHSRLPTAWHNSTWTADRAIDWLKHGRGQRREDRPFCAWVSFPDPHHPFDCPEPWSRLHDPAEIDLPVHRTRSFAGRPWWHEAVLTREPTGSAKSAEIRKSYSRIAEQSDEQLREIIANTYGQIAFIDHQLGRLMIALAEAGLAETTLIFYISDHGDWLGDHGLVLKGPMHYEGLLRVPLIAAGPGVPAGKQVADPVSTLDLSATFADYAGAAPLLPQHGSSLRPLIEGSATRAFALNEWELLPTRAGVALSLRTVRTATHKMTVDAQSGAGELYDLVADPHETTNLFDAPEAAAIRRQLEAMLASRPNDIGPNRVQVGMA